MCFLIKLNLFSEMRYDDSASVCWDSLFLCQCAVHTETTHWNSECTVENRTRSNFWKWYELLTTDCVRLSEWKRVGGFVNMWTVALDAREGPRRKIDWLKNSWIIQIRVGTIIFQYILTSIYSFLWVELFDLVWLGLGFREHISHTMFKREIRQQSNRNTRRSSSKRSKEIYQINLLCKDVQNVAAHRWSTCSQQQHKIKGQTWEI